jgi:hypothetical protein
LHPGVRLPSFATPPPQQWPCAPTLNQSINQSIKQSIQRLLLLLVLLLQHYHHSTAGGTPSPHPPTCHVLLPQSALCPTPTSLLLPYYLPNCFYPSSRSSFATLLPSHRRDAAEAMLMSLLSLLLLLHQRRCVATGADHPGIRGEHSCGSMTNALLCSAPLRSAMQASPQGPCPASPPTACRAFLPILPPTLCWSLWVPAPQARSHVPTCASSQRSHHLGLELELLSTLLCTSCFPSLLC